MGEVPDAAAALAHALRKLREQAGTTYQSIVNHGQRLEPPVKYSAASLSTWMNGKELPRNRRQLVELIKYLDYRAKNHKEYRKVDLVELVSLWDKARKVRNGKGEEAALDETESGHAEGAAPGWPLGAVTNPRVLEVHEAIEVRGEESALPFLPRYVARAHDGELRTAVRRAARGESACAMLVGEPCSGKTRACWEAVTEPGVLTEWRVWHPIDAQAALVQLPAVGPRTVIWLNDAHHYLRTPDPAVGEKVAAGVRELLRDPERTPVLVLGTLWRGEWDLLTADAGERGADPHGHARALINGNEITVPDDFADDTMRARLAEAADSDPRLALALQAAQRTGNWRVIQYLAGVPELMRRYKNAKPAEKALLHAAIDARRLGHGLDLPVDLLLAAAPGYLRDHEWDDLQETDWEHDALAYCTRRVRGVGAPLTRRRPRTAQQRLGPKRPVYRLADYLEQQGTGQRIESLPPTSFWDAALAYASTPHDLHNLAIAAVRRGLYRHAAELARKAIAHGESAAAETLLQAVFPQGPSALKQAAEWIARCADASPSKALGVLTAFEAYYMIGPAVAYAHRIAGVPLGQAAWLDVDDEQHAAFEASEAVNGIDRIRRILFGLKRRDAATILAERAGDVPTLEHVFEQGDMHRHVQKLLGPHPLRSLLDRFIVQLDRFGADAVEVAMRALMIVAETIPTDQSAAGTARSASRRSMQAPSGANPQSPDGTGLGWSETCADILESAAGLWPAAQTVLDALITAIAEARRTQVLDERSCIELQQVLDQPGRRDPLRSIQAFSQRVAELCDPAETRANVRIIHALTEIGAAEAARMLADRLAATAPLGDAHGITQLLQAFQEDFTAAHATLATRIGANPHQLDPDAAMPLLGVLHETGAAAQAAALAPWAVDMVDLQRAETPLGLIALVHTIDSREAIDRIVARACTLPADAYMLSEIVTALAEAGYQDAVAAVAARAHDVSFAEPYGVAHLLTTLARVGASEAVRSLMDRVAGIDPARLGDIDGLADLIEVLREQGALSIAGRIAARAAVIDAAGCNSHTLGQLLGVLEEGGLVEEARSLADRVAREKDLTSVRNNSSEIYSLLTVLSAFPDGQAASHLARRILNAGVFEPSALWAYLTTELPALQHLLVYGREADERTRAANWSVIDFLISPVRI